ncbi:MAG: prolipoprotein diacylglyceryl transferase [Longimicrobiales bacterium]|nr:prolipoprotein diacylglyceryl transferase [Longimicrobiales bacterium]
MYPILFRLPEWLPLLGGEAITSFGVMMLLAFMVSALILRSEMKRVGLDTEHVWDILFMAVVGGFLGARLYYVVLHLDWTLEDPVGMLLSRGGMVWYGGFLGAAGLVVWQIHRSELPLARMADLTAPALAVGYALGRVGCFLVGDDYGRPTDSWVGIAFPEGTPPTRVDVLEQAYGIDVDPELIRQFGEVVPVHPTQLYEVALSTLIFVGLWRIRRHAHGAGWLFMLWLGLAGTERFIVEFVRIKDDRIFGPLSLAQVISIGLVVVGIVGMRRLWEPRVEGDVEDEPTALGAETKSKTGST